MDDYFCECGKRDDDCLLGKGIRIEPFPFKGKEVSIKTNVVSERPRIEITTVPESVYGRKKGIIFYYMKKDDQEALECENKGGMHANSVNAWARNIYGIKPTKMILPGSASSLI